MMTEQEFRSYSTETARYRSLTVPHCKGNVIDIGSGGDPVVPWAIQIDLPIEEYAHYHSADNHPQPFACWRGDAGNLPFKDGVVDTVYSSHVLEDSYDWNPWLKEWVRVLKPGGQLIVLIPDHELWQADIRRGRTPNCQHRHEGRVGELSTYADRLGLEVIEDRLTALCEIDYTIIFRAFKL
jgi:SAM-dependent methyltransferase